MNVSAVPVSIRAARKEGAPPWKMTRKRNRSWDERKAGLLMISNKRCAFQQFLSVRMERITKKFLGRACFNQFACIHDGNIICTFGNDDQIVGDEQDAHAFFMGQGT